MDNYGGLSFEPRRRRSILFLVFPVVFLFTYILLEVSYLITKNKHGSFKQTHSNTPAVEGPKRLFQFLPRELSPLQQLHSLHLYGKGYIGQIKLIFLFSCQRFLYKPNRFITARKSRKFTRGGKQLRTVSILALTSSLHPPLFSTLAKRFSTRAQLFAHYAQSYYVDLNMRHLW